MPGEKQPGYIWEHKGNIDPERHWIRLIWVSGDLTRLDIYEKIWIGSWHYVPWKVHK
jgi:hypothetical protein